MATRTLLLAAVVALSLPTLSTSGVSYRAGQAFSGHGVGVTRIGWLPGGNYRMAATDACGLTFSVRPAVAGTGNQLVLTVDYDAAHETLTTHPATTGRLDPGEHALSVVVLGGGLGPEGPPDPYITRCSWLLVLTQY